VLLRALLSAPRTAPGPSAATDLAAGIDRLHRERRRPGLRVVAVPLRRLAARHDVVAVEVTDPREAELPDVGLVTLVDPESGRTSRSRRPTGGFASATRWPWAEHRSGTGPRAGREPRAPVPGSCWTPSGTSSPAHVVSGAGQVELALPDGRRVAAESVGSDAASDIAVLRVVGSSPTRAGSCDDPVR
jgi:hypothetical protein